MTRMAHCVETRNFHLETVRLEEFVGRWCPFLVEGVLEADGIWAAATGLVGLDDPVNLVDMTLKARRHRRLPLGALWLRNTRAAACTAVTALGRRAGDGEKWAAVGAEIVLNRPDDVGAT